MLIIIISGQDSGQGKGAGIDIMQPPGKIGHGNVAIVQGADKQILTAWRVWPAGIESLDGGKDEIGNRVDFHNVFSGRVFRDARLGVP